MNGVQLSKAVPAIALMLIAEWIQRDKQHALQFTGQGLMSRSIALRYTFYLLLIMTTLVYCGNKAEFIYFQF